MPRIELHIIVEHLPDGQVIPKAIIWDDGRKLPSTKYWINEKLLLLNVAASVPVTSAEYATRK